MSISYSTTFNLGPLGLMYRNTGVDKVTTIRYLHSGIMFTPQLSGTFCHFLNLKFFTMTLFVQNYIYNLMKMSLLTTGDIKCTHIKSKHTSILKDVFSSVLFLHA